MISNLYFPVSTERTVAGTPGTQSPGRAGVTGSSGAAGVADTYEESAESRAFRTLVGRYDITSMSRNDMKEMAQNLYDNGLIDLKALGLLTFDPTRMREAIEKATGTRIGDTITISGWTMSTDPDEPMDFLEGFRIKAQWNRRYGNPAFQDNYDGMVALAERIRRFQIAA